MLWNNRKVHGCPFTVFVSDPTKCVAHGEGLYQARLNESACFEVTTIGAGPGKVNAHAFCGEEEIPIEVMKVTDSTHANEVFLFPANQIESNQIVCSTV